jgi:CheY-like chemotaxis protein
MQQVQRAALSSEGVSPAACPGGSRCPLCTMATIMLVEDSVDIREMMAAALELAGMRVLTAANGQAALRLLRELPPPCLILLDLMMPVMDGWELGAALKRDPRLSAVPVIVVSALSRDMASDVGATAYLPKPIDIDRLLEVVCEHCG